MGVALALTNVSIAASENYLFLETISQTCLVAMIMSDGRLVIVVKSTISRQTTGTSDDHFDDHKATVTGHQCGSAPPQAAE
jgi:hypothetical protein